MQRFAGIVRQKDMKSLLSLLSVLLFGLAMTTDVHACSCGTPFGETEEEQIEKEVARADYIFLGRVTAVRGPKGLDRSPVASLIVLTTWKGLSSDQTTVEVEDLDTCQVGFKKGAFYLVYAYKLTGSPSAKNSGVLFTHNCTRTKPLARGVATDLQRLGPGKQVGTLKRS